MLPATKLVTILSFLLELCSSSQVYNMQPAYITANIGSTGRNIRNLPCISRKSKEAGVCMFAIDCLKSNGTHLGTCIDRFYFGSCCQIEPLHDITENTIDTALIPSRKPPNRISTTERITTITEGNEKSEPTTNIPVITLKDVTTQKERTTLIDDITTKLTTIAKVTEATTVPVRIAPTTTTTQTPTPTGAPVQNDAETTITYKLSTFQSVDNVEVTTNTPKPIQTAKPFVTTKPVLITKPALTTKPQSTTKPTLITRPAPLSTKPTVSTKPTTFTRFPITKPPRPTIATRPITTKLPAETIRPVSHKPTKVTTHKPRPTHNVTVIYRPTTKPRPTVSKPNKLTKPTTKPVVTKSTLKPFKNTTKPVKTTTHVPVKKITTTVISSTEKPTTQTTQQIVTTHKPLERITAPPRVTTITKVTGFTVSTVNLDISSTSTTKPSTTQETPVLTTTEAKLPIPIIESQEISSEVPVVSSTTTTNKPTSTSSTTEFNDIPISSINATQILEAVNGNPATNEIESEKPAKPDDPTIDATTLPAFVTWAQVNDDNTTDIVNLGPSTESSEEPDDWVPITTPDGWVLLPSLSTVTETSIETTTPSSKLTTKSSITSTSTERVSSEATSSESNESPLSSSTTTTTASSAEVLASSTSTTLAPIETRTNVTTETPTTTSSNASAGNIETSTIGVGHPHPVDMTDFTDVCGRRMFPEARIVGGDKSAFGKWPWQISLRQWRTSTYLHKCGAALLNEKWAITAAHCVDNVPPSDLLLRLGEHDLSTESEPYFHQERRVQIVASHPQFDPRTFEYDLALLRFNESVTFQPNILPVCVPQNDENFVGRTAYVTGWGRLYEDGPLPSILQEVSVPVINNTVCESMYRSAGYIEHIPNIFICAGWRRGGFDSCEGDSGGPMVIQRPDKRFLLAGVISWGIGCAEPNQPGVYTRISEFRDWINQILQF